MCLRLASSVLRWTVCLTFRLHRAGDFASIFEGLFYFGDKVYERSVMQGIGKWILAHGHKVLIYVMSVLYFAQWLLSGIDPMKLFEALQKCAGA